MTEWTPENPQSPTIYQEPNRPGSAYNPAVQILIPGPSAYEVAVTNGFVGTVEEWLDSLVGAVGPIGPNGLSAYQVALLNGFVGTEAEWVTSLEGPQGIQGIQGIQGVQGDIGPAGATAYELAVDNGFVGTEVEWLASLEGPQGDPGPAGADGAAGPEGPLNQTYIVSNTQPVDPASIGPHIWVDPDSEPATTILLHQGGTVQAPSAGAIPLILKGFAGQTADLQRWTDSTDVIKSRIGRDGGIYALGGNQDGYALFVQPSGGAANAAVIRGAAGSSVNLQEWQNSAGTVLDFIDANGRLKLQSAVAASVRLQVQGAASQTANLAEFQNSAGGVIAAIDEDGNFTTGGGGGDGAIGRYGAILQSPNNKGLVIKGAAAQTANLAEFQNSAGTILGYVQASGAVVLQPTAQAGWNTLAVYHPNPASPAMQIRGAAAQTANLQEWANSGGTVLAQITANGTFHAYITDSAGNNGATRLMQVGAADSAGAGRRWVTVAN